ncbi:hypothetical protein EIO_1968 [Ketogulonicigenium vulgare Y25]|uniref:Uncharacterized protein n=1 Tax=Ketogulonicigenium vulgare (strain WSH-001) TaxID=759362 RepID=F9Y947_KETVW|nr:hypothetical protein EIO_1968 [Ketogulonicigenium vulgare Y25]AEM41264.1 hypothetical protein KVU_1425 [Ketogulonicigenium vulgare WSH-001]ALJ81402.1 hypothetical protein KVH_09545 [Ketogulonicigenium vulgare]ANW35079.1 hypothetical protein KvSKV_09495 [Ketogulonicigenium vulgare]AOZ54997.1 hypothetical protein KVC_1990 [Ketogulonicigenium vulgare]
MMWKDKAVNCLDAGCIGRVLIYAKPRNRAASEFDRPAVRLCNIAPQFRPAAPRLVTTANQPAL